MSPSFPCDRGTITSALAPPGSDRKGDVTGGLRVRLRGGLQRGARRESHQPGARQVLLHLPPGDGS
eukprot:4562347-Pyramimonas_sp.AAC.1